MKKACIFLDNNSSTQVDPRVLEVYLSTIKESIGNSSSKHFYGWKSESLLEIARENIAKLFNTSAECVTFTSGATESNNLALLGLSEEFSFVSSRIEHSSIYEPLNHLYQEGRNVDFIKTNKEGRVELNLLKTSSPTLLTFHHANNEIGVVEDFINFKKSPNTLLHTDASQSIGKLPLSFASHPVDIISISGHKIHAPKGIGALIFRSKKVKSKFSPILFGGFHNDDLRPGTIPVALCVALEKALEIAFSEMEETSFILSEKTVNFFTKLSQSIPGLILVGPQDFSKRLPGLLSLSFPNINSAQLISNLANKVAFSAGAACKLEKSRVATEVLNDENLIRGFSRFGISKFTSEEDLELASSVIVENYRKLL